MYHFIQAKNLLHNKHFKRHVRLIYPTYYLSKWFLSDSVGLFKNVCPPGHTLFDFRQITYKVKILETICSHKNKIYTLILLTNAK